MSASAFDIAASGMAAHRAEMDIIAENIANAGATRSGSGEQYRQRRAVFEPDEPGSFTTVLNDVLEAGDDTDADVQAPTGVRLAGIVESSAPIEYRFDPSNPFAIAAGARRGFVAEPDVDPIEQMVSLVSAGRAYDADVAALQAAKQMDVEAVEVDRQ